MERNFEAARAELHQGIPALLFILLFNPVSLLAQSPEETSASSDHSRSVVIVYDKDGFPSAKFYQLRGTRKVEEPVDAGVLTRSSVHTAISVTWPREGPYVALTQEAKYGSAVYFADLSAAHPKLNELVEPKWEQVIPKKEYENPQGTGLTSWASSVFFSGDSILSVEWGIGIWRNGQCAATPSYIVKYDLVHEGKLLSINQGDGKTDTQSLIRFSAADAKLNKIYKRLMEKLDKPAQAKLKIAQVAWIEFRDAEAAFEVDIKASSAAMPSTTDNVWRTEITNQRTAELEKLLKN